MANISTGVYGHFGNFSAANQLPNVAAAPTQTRELSVGDLATVGAAVYVCTVATLGAATWTQVGSGGGGGRSLVYAPTIGGMVNTADATFAPGYPVATFTPNDSGVGGVVQVSYYVELTTLANALTTFTFPIPSGLVPSGAPVPSPGLAFVAESGIVTGSFRADATECTVSFAAASATAFATWGTVTYNTAVTPA